jgi:hypothetical protein
MSGNYIDLPVEGGGSGSGVSSVNGATGSIIVSGSGGISVNTTGQDITISGAGGSATNRVQVITLAAFDISNKYVTLTETPTAPSDVTLSIGTAPGQSYGVDYTVSGTILTWSGLGLDGVLSIGDILTINYF